MKKMLVLIILSVLFAAACTDDTTGGKACKDACTNAETRCTADKKAVEKCVLQNNSCTAWVKTDCTDAKMCANKVEGNKTSHSCEKIPTTTCTAGEKRCESDNVETCNATGTAWEVTEECDSPKKCDASSFTCKEGTAPVCTAGEKRCEADNVETCKADGSAWEVTEECDSPEKCDPSSFTCEAASCTTNADCEFSQICSSSVCVNIEEGGDCDDSLEGTTRCADDSTLLTCTLSASEMGTSYKWVARSCSNTCETNPTSKIDACDIE